jgi:hypothetical protein
MVQNLRAKGITISETPDRRDLITLFGDNDIVDMLEFVRGKRPGVDFKKVDSWDIERIDRSSEEGEGVGKNGAE